MKLQAFIDIIQLRILFQLNVMQDVLCGRIRVALRLNCYVILLITVRQEPEETLYLCTIIRFPSPTFIIMKCDIISSQAAATAEYCERRVVCIRHLKEFVRFKIVSLR